MPALHTPTPQRVHPVMTPTPHAPASPSRPPRCAALPTLQTPGAGGPVPPGARGGHLPVRATETGEGGLRPMPPGPMSPWAAQRGWVGEPGPLLSQPCPQLPRALAVGGGPVQAHRVGGLGEPEPQPCLRARTTRASWRPCRSRWAPGTAQRRTRRRRSRRTKVSALQSGAGPGPRAGRGLREDTAPGRSLELCWSAPSPWGPRPACPRGKASLSPGGGIRGGEGLAAAGTPQARACAHRQEQPGPWGGGCERGLQAGDLRPLTRVLPVGGGASPGRGHSAPHLATFFPNGGLGG